MILMFNVVNKRYRYVDIDETNIDIRVCKRILLIIKRYVVDNTRQSCMNYRLVHSQLFLGVYRDFCLDNGYNYNGMYYAPSAALGFGMGDEYKCFCSYMCVLQDILFAKHNIKQQDSMIVFTQCIEYFDTIEAKIETIYNKYFLVDIVYDRYLMLLLFKNMLNEVVIPHYNTLDKYYQTDCDEIQAYCDEKRWILNSVKSRKYHTT